MKSNKIKNKYNIFSCNCSFCNQFYFLRLSRQQYIKSLNNLDNSVKYNDTNKEGKLSNTINNNSFTIIDYDIVKSLSELNLNSDQISKKTNISKSFVQYILSKIY